MLPYKARAFLTLCVTSLPFMSTIVVTAAGVVQLIPSAEVIKASELYATAVNLELHISYQNTKTTKKLFQFVLFFRFLFIFK